MQFRDYATSKERTYYSCVSCVRDIAGARVYVRRYRIEFYSRLIRVSGTVISAFILPNSKRCKIKEINIVKNISISLVTEFMTMMSHKEVEYINLTIKILRTL